MEHPILEVHDLTVRIRKAAVLSGIQFAVQPGEIMAIFGPFGSGKSALLSGIAGLLPIDGGVRLCGASPARTDDRIELALPMIAGKAITVQQWLLKRAASSGVPLAPRAGRVARALDSLDLFAHRDTPLKELSDGQQRSTFLAGALASGSSVLLIDGLLDSLPEPLVERAWSHLRSRVAKEDAAVIFSTVRSELAERSDRVLILDSGRMLACSPPEEILSAHGMDTVTIEAIDPSTVRGTLRGIADVEMEDVPGGVRFTVPDGSRAAVGVFRHPPQGVRTVYVRRPTLWDALNRLRELNRASVQQT